LRLGDGADLTLESLHFPPSRPPSYSATCFVLKPLSFFFFSSSPVIDRRLFESILLCPALGRFLLLSCVGFSLSPDAMTSERRLIPGGIS